MSDFDKEAERERLREKYERDEKKREVTERMSELLLQGATMTNAHCQDCGDPIFRYDGQEFCPTCEKAVQRDTGGEDDEDANDGDTDGDAATPAGNGDQEEIEVATPDERRVQFGASADADGESERETPGADRAAEGDAAEGAGAQTRSQDPAQARAKPQQPPTAPADRTQPAAGAGREVPSVDPDETGHLGVAHASLSRTVTQLARQAEATDDLGRKRDLLAATREAADALAALRDAGR